MTPALVFGFSALTVLGVMLREHLARWVRCAREAVAAPEADVPPPSLGPYRAAGGAPPPCVRPSLPTFVMPPSETVYRRDRLVYVAIIVGGPLSLLNAFVVPFFAEPLLGASALGLAVAIPCAAVIGARINRRHPTVPEGVALWSILHHLGFAWHVVSAGGDPDPVVALTIYALIHAGVMAVAARASW